MHTDAMPPAASLGDAQQGAWMASSRSLDGLVIEEDVVRHLRGGRTDVARGANLLGAGKHKITFEIKETGSPKGFGIAVGVADASAPLWNEPPPVEGVCYPMPKYGEPGFKPSPPAVAWGFCPGTRKFIESVDGKSGLMEGARLLERLDSPAQSPLAGQRIEFTINRPTHSAQEASIALRDVGQHQGYHALHPLAQRRAYPRHLQQPRSPIGLGTLAGQQLSFAVDGGEIVYTEVQLPEAVYPWVILGWEGDAVATKVETISDPQPK